MQEKKAILDIRLVKSYLYGKCDQIAGIGMFVGSLCVDELYSQRRLVRFHQGHGSYITWGFHFRMSLWGISNNLLFDSQFGFVVLINVFRFNTDAFNSLNQGLKKMVNHNGFAFDLIHLSRSFM